MIKYKIFIDRRVSEDRRTEHDPCKNLSIDIYHRKRRKASERRHIPRSLAEDYMAYGDQSEIKSIH